MDIRQHELYKDGIYPIFHDYEMANFLSYFMNNSTVVLIEDSYVKKFTVTDL